MKAGMFPMHVWLPEAHPAAPSHVSALMSGVMIKTGVYGILRVLQAGAFDPGDAETLRTAGFVLPPQAPRRASGARSSPLRRTT